MSSAGAEIEGLRDFSRAVKKASNETAKEMRRELKSEIAEPLARSVRGNVPVRSGTWRRSIRAGATQRGAHITWGRARVPYAGWMEFGGQLPSKASGRPARVVRTRTPGGRYVYPEIARARPETEQTVQQLIHRTFQRVELSIEET